MAQLVLVEDKAILVDVGFNVTYEGAKLDKLRKYLEQYAAREGLTIEAVLRFIARGDYDLVLGTTMSSLVKIDVEWKEVIGSKNYVIKLHSAYSPFIPDIIKFFRILPEGYFEEEEIGQGDLFAERGDGNREAHEALNKEKNDA